MPATTTIKAEQRRGLYELVRNDLGGIGDVTIALEERGDIATAERLGRRFAEDLRLTWVGSGTAVGQLARGEWVRRPTR